LTPFLTHPSLAALSGISHGYFTRQGGASSGIYASLNCGIGSADDSELVRANRAAAATALGVSPEALASPYQVHGTAVATLDQPWATGQPPRCDGLVTDRPGVMIAIGTADCGPVLFADGKAGVIGAAHAGWRGALAGVLEATIEAMVDKGARRSRIVATLGPTISAANYEVGDTMMEEFRAADAANQQWFSPAQREGHAMFDLPGYIVARLEASGIGHAAALNLCTDGNPDRFFSYRRTTHRGETDYGRMLAAIVLRE